MLFFSAHLDLVSHKLSLVMACHRVEGVADLRDMLESCCNINCLSRESFVYLLAPIIPHYSDSALFCATHEYVLMSQYTIFN
jgi:hypothetical protein